DPAQLGAVQFQPAGAASSRPQQGGARPVLGAQRLVQREQVGGQRRGERLAVAAAAGPGGGQGGQRRGAAPRGGRQCPLRRYQLTVRRVEVRLDRLALLHHLEQVVLQYRLPPRQGVQLVLQVGGLLGGQPGPGEQRAVPVGPAAHAVDVSLQPADL